jgi:hypothetical protein
MATVTAINRVSAGLVSSAEWTGIATGDTVTSYPTASQMPLGGSVQFSGVFGGATASISVSNDNVTFFPLKDVHNDDISCTSAAFFEFSTAANYIKPVVTGGTGDAVTTTISLRG